jgi:uncharacterized membrane protein YdbT with pleckstrin-like domain
MPCPTCGAETSPNAKFCAQCGACIVPGSVEAQAAVLYPSPEAAGHDLAQPTNGEPSETVIWVGGYSPKAMLGGWCLSGLLSIIAVVIAIVWPPNSYGWWLLAAVFFLPWLYHLAILAYRRAGIRYTLTTQQLIHESGILRRDNNRIETLMMNDIAYSQTLLQRLVGVGDIKILSGDTSHPTFVLRGIDDVDGVTETFNAARREERRLHGVHVEQI